LAKSITPKAAFTALSKLSGKQPDIKHFADFDKETRGELSHRGAAILAVTNVENALETALLDELIYTRARALFGMDCPLGSFRNKILMAYALNIFGDQMCCNLECMRHIRNAFAHAKIPISFSDIEVMNVCNSMIFPPLMPPHIMGAEKEDHSNLIGLERFRKICEVIAHNLGVRSFHRPRKIDPSKLIGWPYTEVVARVEPLP
jgi:hypothetical protein